MYRYSKFKNEIIPQSSAADEINIISIDSSLISQENAVVKERKKIQSLTDVATSLEFYLHGMSKLPRESPQFHFQRNFDILQSSVWNN